MKCEVSSEITWTWKAIYIQNIPEYTDIVHYKIFNLTATVIYYQFTGIYYLKW